MPRSIVITGATCFLGRHLIHMLLSKGDVVYAVCRGEENLISALDEMTSMKILSRIEGDIDRTKEPLDLLEKIVNEKIVAKLPKDKDGNAVGKSISAAKIEEMKVKLNRSSYTSFWS